MEIPFEKELSQVPNETENVQMTQENDEDTSLQHFSVMDSQQHQEEGSLKRAGENLDNVEKKRTKNEAVSGENDDWQEMRREIQDFSRKQEESMKEIQQLREELRELSKQWSELAKKNNRNVEKVVTYEELCPEVRQIILSFTDMQSLFAYAQCSKACNEDIQAFRKPYAIELEDEDGGILITQKYLRTQEVKTKKVERADRFNMMGAIKQYIRGQCKFFFDKTAPGVLINLRTWPKEIMNMSEFARTRNMEVRMYQSVYDEFLDYSRTKRVENDEDGDKCPMSLYLTFCDERENEATITPEFFQCGFIDDLETLWINSNFRINREDFVNRHFNDLRVRHWSDLEAIRQKVEMIDEKNWQIMRFDLRQSEHPRFNIAELFPRERFEVRYITRYCKFKISPDVHGKICGQGRYLKLKVVDNWDDPYESDAYDTDTETDGEEDIRTDDEMELEVGEEIGRRGADEEDDEIQIIRDVINLD